MNRMQYPTFNELRDKLAVFWERGKYLSALAESERNKGVTEDLFPLRVPVKVPGQTFLLNNFKQVQQKIAAMQSACSCFEMKIEWREINHRQLGKNSVPSALIIPDLSHLAALLGTKSDLASFTAALAVLKEWDLLLEWAAKYPFSAVAQADDLQKLLSVLMWRIGHPMPSIYLRQLTLPGVDTKFIEAHRKTLSEWFDRMLPEEEINEEASGSGKFEKRYGFLYRSELVRFRLLDPDLTDYSYTDLSVPSDEFASSEIPAETVFVVENDVTALAFPPLKGAMLIYGRGYDFTALEKAAWLKKKQICYWGDIDTHGFAILDQFRAIFPKTQSLLMDRETLLSHEVHWGEETKQARAELLTNLTGDELRLYQDLKKGTMRKNLRLEQEFVSFTALHNALKSVI